MSNYRNGILKKKSLPKVMEISQQLLCKKHFQRDVHCAKKYFDDILVFLRFPLRDGFLPFCLGFDFGSDICVSKFGICLLCEIRFL